MHSGFHYHKPDAATMVCCATKGGVIGTYTEDIRPD